jgi:penicillin amidase
VNGNLKPLLNIGPLPRGGKGQTYVSTGGTDNQMSCASFRILIDTQDWDKKLLSNSPGHSGDPKSPFL